jgi:fumarylacetoacetate (FAA) hydrolase family protein
VEQSEPEIVLAINSRGETVGATLGNDVNLRDFEGRSAPACSARRRTTTRRARSARSCACSIAIFTIDSGAPGGHPRSRSEGPDGFMLEGSSSIGADQPRSARTSQPGDRAQPSVSGRA